MESIDPSTGRALPADAIQRILFIAPAVHVYNIPPLTSTKGYVAASWTADNNKRQIFTARLRVLEAAIPTANNEESVKTDILLEDPSNGQLFAAAPYTTPGIVEQVLDSSRFFAIRVEGEGGRKAVLGIGFEERSEAFDFSVALQEARKTLGIEDNGKAGGKKVSKEKEKIPEKKDFSLKEGETITVNIGGRGRRNLPKAEESSGSLGGFSLPPPPGNGGNAGSSLLPPPPSAQEAKAQKRLSQNFEMPKPSTVEDFGFDDGEFGEFQ
ncbi:Adaptin ear-binding coat-associated protein [Lachnellula suecica]|uniref:Adaptin ear-binding coat-associated protein n=1 Tax=Lachnellula suecica TaxID=602035 RepID=A0A8T9BYA1_9HELO|nr:Adaptin ear-binding coat-associated protein [Lachnellula suecica]